MLSVQCEREGYEKEFELLLCTCKHLLGAEITLWVEAM